MTEKLLMIFFMYAGSLSSFIALNDGVFNKFSANKADYILNSPQSGRISPIHRTDTSKRGVSIFK